MADLIHEFIARQATQRPDSVAVAWRTETCSYGELGERVIGFSRALQGLGLVRRDRVAVYLPKQLEAVVAFFGAAAAGAVFVPVNPLLKAEQVTHILRDCSVRVLVTSGERAGRLTGHLKSLPNLKTLVLVDARETAGDGSQAVETLMWDELQADHSKPASIKLVDSDLAAILYTSGSTGMPKGVVLSHRNLVAGAHSVTQYLENRAEDRILAVLPFSFDYGLSQLTTAFAVGARVTLLEYLFSKDVVAAVAREAITGLAAVPPVWIELARQEWPPEASQSLRYITNSGGSMPRPVVASLRQRLPSTDVFLMYGLTEAFRSTYLHPSEVDARPDSIGKAIPNAEISVVREDGSCCAANEPGELVHRGALVALGYWNDPAKTAERFRPAPGLPKEVPIREIAVWSGDTVRADEDGFLYFVARRDEMIKTSGYRVSPTEIEEVLYASGMVAEAVAVGLPHPALGQGIAAVVVPATKTLQSEHVLEHCQRFLPRYMVPQEVIIRESLPRNPNGKVDRTRLAVELKGVDENETG